MQLDLDYLTLRMAYPVQKEGERFRVTVDELAEVLFCTPRNVKIILKKMKQKGWIDYIPGRGRGITSLLQFNYSKEKILFERVRYLIEHGNLQEGFSEINKYGDGTTVRRQIGEWLNQYFGMKSENVSEYFKKDILRFPVFRTLNTLDPAEGYFTFDTHITRQIFEPLFDYNVHKREVTPLLVHEWEVSENKLLWRFYLKKGIRFHNGRVMQAADVVFSFNRLRDVENRLPQSWLMDKVKDVCALNPLIVEVTLSEPNELFLQYLSHPATAIIPFEACHPKTSKLLTPIGTGPFHYRGVTKEKFELIANQEYFREKPYLDKVEIITVPSQDYLSFTNENEVIIDSGETDLQEDLCDQYDYIGSSILSFNQTKGGALNHFNFRQLIDQLINREQMVEDLGAPNVSPAFSFFDEGQEGKLYIQDKSTVECSDGDQRDSLTLFTYSRHEKDAHWIANHLKEFGIDIQVHIVHWGDLLNQELVEQADMIIFEPVFSRGEISEIELYCHGNSFLKIHLGNESNVEKRISVIISTESGMDRREKLRELETYMKENYYFLFLTRKKVRTIHHPAVQGLKLSDNGWVDFQKVWVKPIIKISSENSN